jgi:hypothetical protein
MQLTKYRMDDLYFTPGPSLKISDTVNNKDPVLLSVVIIAAFIQIVYIYYIMRLSCQRR